VKGKPWSLEDEKKLKDWVNSGVSVEAFVFSFDGKYTKDAILKKAERLGLVVGVEKKSLRRLLLNLFYLRSCRVLKKRLKS
jgi:hypothetical protein